MGDGSLSWTRSKLAARFRFGHGAKQRDYAAWKASLFSNLTVSHMTNDRGAVFYAKADGSFIAEVIYPSITPNGIGLSPDDRTLYVAETEAARLWAWRIVEPGVLRKEPWPSPHGGRLIADPGGVYQRFDSLAVDSAGNVCVATLVNGGITVISPDGRSIEHIPMPDLYTTNICFGGEDLRTAYVTLSNSGRLVATEWPRPGQPLHHLNW
jgi:gluconolactonase